VIIKHHLSDLTLGAFSAGSLTESISLVAASHISLCPSCLERLEKLEELGGTQLQRSEPEDMTQDALHKVMAKLGKQELRQEPNPVNDLMYLSSGGPSLRGGTPKIPQPLQAYVPDKLENLEWKSLAPGIKYFAISTLQTAGGTLSMLKIAPSVNIPEHGHQGIELTQILKGSFRDEVGCFSVGDIADLDGDTIHQPIVDSDESCVCLIASEAPLKFTGIVPRLVNYFSGM
jgi:putative transcriptional regulator